MATRHKDNSNRHRHQTRQQRRHRNPHALRFLQANLGKGFQAQHEFFQYFHNNDYQIALINEPYTGSGTTVTNTHGHDVYQYTDGSRVKACIVVKKGNISTIGMRQHSSPNLCSIRINLNGAKVYVTCIYLEPRISGAAAAAQNCIVDRTLRDLEEFVQANPDAAHIIGGDLNGWHPMWGSPRANRRGNEIAEFIMTSNLIVCNTGVSPTFVSTTSGAVRESIIDITLASGRAADRISNWRVNPDACPASDHHAVEFFYDVNKRDLNRHA
ncbi:uncharacterized protein LOC128201755 [Galleria mellonella]|uniref:Uncharacterized protein LOC128201755 n=1 Tax=Galleria mellonella TaxID=7137 RepID=A0ABM3MW54_GALME|nr:uncharacterized protein LOC128201755 [Galleria mellonella]